MFNTELYIDGVRVDLFQDENISITDTIQNIRDLSKVFTSFTQDFSIPASKTNNKVLKHYYNNDIVNGFDARFSVPAIIKLSGVDYKKGSVKLVDVKLKNNKAYSYTVRFYGDGIDLRNKIADSILSYLDFSELNHAYNGATVRTGLEYGLGSNGSAMVQANGTTVERSIIYPFITHTKRYVFDTGSTPYLYDTTDGDRLQYNQLKPAIKLIRIIEAIESYFDIEFTRDFFGTDEFLDLYMWLNKNEGVLYGGVLQNTVIYPDQFSYSGATSDNAYYNGSDVGFVLSSGPNNPTYPGSMSVTWDVTYDIVTGGTGKYNVTILCFDENGSTVNSFYQENDIAAGSKSISISYDVSGYLNGWEEKKFFPRIFIESEGTISTIDVDMTLERHYRTSSTTVVDTTGVYDISTVTATTDIAVSSHMPNQEVMTFLTGLFKMFNLTAEKDADGKIYVDTLDNYYANGNEIDITKYIDVSSHTVTPGALYDTIEFEYDGTETKLIEARQSELGDVFGDMSYSLGNVFGDSTYTVSLPFSHLMFERLYDDNTSGYSEILTGLYVDSSDNAIVGEPLIFYNNGTQTIPSSSTRGIEWDYDSGAVKSAIYQQAGNVRTSGGVQTLNFNAELDEWTRNTYTDSLFKNYYSTYIGDVFGSDVRLKTYEAYLPIGFVLTYKMNDTIIVGGRKHRINSISIDLIDGKSTLELITI